MTDSAASVLLWAAASVAFIHTLVGVDHYLPFILIGKARRWSVRRTMALTALCGAGHVGSSMVLGLVGIGLGAAVQRLEIIQGVRGSLAAWGLIAFGLIYAAASMVRTARGHEHTHAHAHEDGTLHDHRHNHHEAHGHQHAAGQSAGLTWWTLFIIFVLGPCEALIPMFMAPAFEHDWGLVLAVAGVFSLVTVSTMLGLVAAGVYGLSRVPTRGLERHANALAGLAIAISGVAIQALGI